MGSFPSPPLPTTTAPLPENSSSCYRVYASFCSRELVPNVNASNWIECYDPCNNSWWHVGPIPGLLENHVLKDFAMASIGDSLYVIGGRLCRKERSQHPNDGCCCSEVDVEVVSWVLCYNFRYDKWSKCAPLNVPRYHFASTVFDNKIYVAGGQSRLASARGISSAEVYDPSLDQWIPLPNMSTSRYKCVGVTWQGKIHVVGGFVERGASNLVLPYIDRSSAEVYNAVSGKWDLRAGMWQLDVPPNQIAAVEGGLFSSGDCLNAWKGHIETYDGNLNIWYMVEGSQHKLVPFPMCTSNTNEGNNGSPMQRLYLTMAPIGTHLYFVAGYRMLGGGESSTTLSMVHSFDTSATRDAWTSFEPMLEVGERELCSHCCVVQVS